MHKSWSFSATIGFTGLLSWLLIKTSPLTSSLVSLCPTYNSSKPWTETSKTRVLRMISSPSASCSSTLWTSGWQKFTQRKSVMSSSCFTTKPAGVQLRKTATTPRVASMHITHVTSEDHQIYLSMPPRTVRHYKTAWGGIIANEESNVENVTPQ